jgi:anti-sigma-K factor RskA
VKLLGHDLHTLTGVYALDAIDGSERERFEHHLQRCPSCGNEVRGLQETATRLAVAVAVSPPEQMKFRVLASVAGTRQLPPPLVESHLRPLPSPSARWTRRVAVPLAAACLAVAVALGVLLGVARHQLGTATAQQREIAAVLTAPGSKIVREPTSLGGEATVVVAATLHKFIFTTSGLPALADSRVYELWVMRPDGSATRVGLLASISGGKTAPVLADGLKAGDRVGVTVEPAGGTTKPTTTPIVAIGPT